MSKFAFRKSPEDKVKSAAKKAGANVTLNSTDNDFFQSVGYPKGAWHLASIERDKDKPHAGTKALDILHRAADKHGKDIYTTALGGNDSTIGKGLTAFGYGPSDRDYEMVRRAKK